MNSRKGRRALLISGLSGAAAAAALGAAIGKPATGPAARPSRETQWDQEVAARQVSNCMNRYETYLSQAYLEKALAEYALSTPDVQVDVGFGLYYGPASVRRLFLDLHGVMLGDREKGTVKNGALYVDANTTPIIEVAEDLKTAKGMWLCPEMGTKKSKQGIWEGSTGYIHRCADFYNENGHWKIWHYMVFHLSNAPVGKSWTDPEVVAMNQVNQANAFPDFKPDSPSAPGIGRPNSWRPDHPTFAPPVPVPYRTFSETFSYGRNL